MRICYCCRARRRVWPWRARGELTSPRTGSIPVGSTTSSKKEFHTVKLLFVSARGELTPVLYHMPLCRIKPRSLALLFMELFVNLAEALIGEVRVELCGGDRGVAEHFLNGADVGAVHEEFGGK